MSYQALARKWRPKSFADLVSQEHVVIALANALKTQRLHHAYLFTGTRGVGKTTLARIFAKSLNCETGVSPTPCGVCAACVSIDSGSFVDLIEVDAATNTRVEEMRELLDNTQYMPTAGRFKVYIIDEVHMLSRSAFNSMLKTLEEPPEHVKFILATTDPQKVPVTVLSRCLQFNLKQMPREAITGHLERVLAAENVAFEPAALQSLARAAQGSMRDSLSLLDQAIAYGAGKVSVQTVTAMLGSVDQEYLFNLLERIASGDGRGLMEEAERIAERSISFDAALQGLATLLHQIAIQQVMPAEYAEGTSEQVRVNALSQRFTPEDVQLFYQIAIVGRKDLPLAPDEFAGFTMVLMRMLAFALEVQTSGERPVRPSPAIPVVPPRVQNRSAAEARPSVPPAPAIETSASAPYSPSVEATKSPAPQFDGDWLLLASKLKLAGMAGMLASHCELQSFVDSRVDLTVPPEHKHLADNIYIEKLQAALSHYFGLNISLRVSVGSGSGNTLAQVEERGRKAKQNEAVAAIEQDVFVRDLVENLDAKLIESSIRPIQP